MQTQEDSVRFGCTVSISCPVNVLCVSSSLVWRHPIRPLDHRLSQLNWSVFILIWEYAEIQFWFLFLSIVGGFQTGETRDKEQRDLGSWLFHVSTFRLLNITEALKETGGALYR